MLPPKALDQGQTFTLPEDGTMVGLLLCGNDDTASAYIQLNGNLIAYIANAATGSGGRNVVFIPLKISLKKDMKIATSATTSCTLYFS